MTTSRPAETPKGCAGPLVWFDVEEMPCPCNGGHQAAILLCVTCGYIVCTGGVHDEAHHATEMMRSPH